MSVEVQTTQNVTIDYEPAGLGYRILAYFIDWLIIGVLILVVAGISYILYYPNFLFNISSIGIILSLIHI